MKRIQFIELHEQPWFPAFLRNHITDALQQGLKLAGAYAPVFPLLQSALETTGACCVVDLCSGGGGPWLDFAQKFEANRDDLCVLLTDKYPNSTAVTGTQRRSGIGVRFCEESVDARDVPPKLDGFRTMFTSFHDFPPAAAEAIIQNAADARQGIGIFEVTRRSLSAIILVAFWSFMPSFFTPFIRPFRASRLLFTYVVPVIPFVLLFDGVISCLRTYRVDELRTTAAQSDAGYKWQAGELRGSATQVPITYLLGIPEN